MTNLSARPGGVLPFYKGRGTAEQWIHEVRYALNWIGHPYKKVLCNNVGLRLFALAYHLGNYLRRLALPQGCKH